MGQRWGVASAGIMGVVGSVPDLVRARPGPPRHIQVILPLHRNMKGGHLKPRSGWSLLVHGVAMVLLSRLRDCTHAIGGYRRKKKRRRGEDVPTLTHTVFLSLNAEGGPFFFFAVLDSDDAYDDEDEDEHEHEDEDDYGYKTYDPEVQEFYDVRP